MIDRRATPEDLRDALEELQLAASGFVRGRGMAGARKNLADAIAKANRVLEAEDAFPTCRDAEALIAAYIDAGGDWCALAAAVNRAGLAGRPHAARHKAA